MGYDTGTRVGREYPATPLVGVVGVVVLGEDVLLIRRGREPMLGAWSLPGGLLEVGETTADGVAREVFEETGVPVRPVEIVATLDRIVRDDEGRVRFHYVLVEWLCLPQADWSGKLMCGDDAVAATWVGRDEIYSETYGLGEPTLAVIEKTLKLAETREMKFALRVLAVVLILFVAAGLVLYFNPLWVADQQIRLKLWRAGVQSRYVKAGGYRMHYFEASPPNGTPGTPLLLVHGLGARAEDWQAMIPALAAKGFHVYAPDLLGYGRSPQPDVNYSIAMQETAVMQFMQAVGLSRADVGGWSMGGWIAMKLALDHPELVDRLVVYDSAGIYFPPTFGDDLFVPTDTAGVTRLFTILSPHPPQFPDFVTKALLRKFADNGWVINRSMASMTTGRDLLDFRLHGMQRPTLVMWGSRDDLIPLATGKKIHELIPGSVLNVVEGCGHLAPLECSQPVVEGTVDFLRADPPMQGGERVLSAR